MILNEVGLECEYWLLDESGNIREAPKYNFPADEMGFLIELRGDWGRDPNTISMIVDTVYYHTFVKAKGLGFYVIRKPEMKVSREWQEYIADKYEHDEMKDMTQNIYGIDGSHHTGFMDGRATAGLHIHFSSFDTEKEEFRGYEYKEIERIVNTLDCHFIEQIRDTNRLEGEWEPKPYHGGFEYRSLPCTTNYYEAAQWAITAVDNVVPRKPYI